MPKSPRFRGSENTYRGTEQEVLEQAFKIVKQMLIIDVADKALTIQQTTALEVVRGYLNGRAGTPL